MKFFAYSKKLSRWVPSSERITLMLLLLAASALSFGAHFSPLTLVQLPKVCHAKRILPSGSSDLSLKTSFKASWSTAARDLVPLSMSFSSILPESSSDKITLGATYGCAVPGGELARVIAQAGFKAALAATAITWRRNLGDVVR
ncbi:MAG: hypothetical protein PHE74_04240 [Comamonas sp.]|nr:hypothetical protein [Comamonas sp.]